MSNNTLLDTAKGDVVSITMQTIAASTIIAPTISLTTSTVLVNNIAATTNISAGGNIAATGSISATGNVVSVTGNVTAGGNVVATGNVVVGGLTKGSVANNITVPATTDVFASAVALTAQVNVVGTVAVGASTAAPVALPTVAAALGAPITVFNQTTRSVAVWPQSTDIIDIASTGAAVILGIGHRAIFYPVGTTQYISAQMGTTSV